MFIRLGTLTKVSVLQGFRKNASLASEWRDIVAGRSYVQQNDVFDYDTENFLYFRCRAVSPGPNGNGDYFPPEEIKRAYKTFVGKPFCIEHDSDTADKARGVILDASLHEEGDFYVECLVAVDKVRYPDIARNLELGILNSVSMGCVCSEAECSICGNVAKDTEHLCPHMNKDNINYVKGRSNEAFEINRGITYVELSGVRNPAFNDTKIFEVMASQLNDKLKNELMRYASSKREEADENMAVGAEGVKASQNSGTSKLRKLVNSISGIKEKLANGEFNLGDGNVLKPFRAADNRTLMQLFKQGQAENVFIEPIYGDLSEEQKAKKYKAALNLEAMKCPKCGKQIKENTEGNERYCQGHSPLDEPIKKETKKEGATQPKETCKQAEKEEVNMFNLSYVEGTSLDTSYFLAKEGDKEHKVKASEVVPKEVQESILSGKTDTVISPEQAVEQIVKECGSTLQGFQKWALMEKVKNIRRAKMKDLKKKDVKKEEAAEDAAASKKAAEEKPVAKTAEARKERIKAIIAAARARRAAKTAEAAKPAEKVEEKSAEAPKVAAITPERRKELAARAHRRAIIARMKMRKKANYMDIENSSIRAEEKADKGETIAIGTDQVAQNVKEQKAGWTGPTGSAGSKVKEYYNKLGNPSGGTPVPGDNWAMKTSALEKENADLKAKLASTEAEKTLLEKKAAMKDKAEMIDQIIAGLDFESEEEKSKTIEELASMDTEKLQTTLQLKAKTASKVAMPKTAGLEEGKNIPPVFAGQDSRSTVDKMSDLLESEVPKI